MGKILGIVVLILGLCAATIVVSAWEWGQLGDTSMTTAGYIWLTVGAIVTSTLGCGLMGLIFYSSRRGYDEPPQFERAPNEDSDATRNI